MPAMETDFVAADFDAGTWDAISPKVDELMARPVESATDLERWLLDRSELEAAISESAAIRYIDMTCDTANEAKKQAYLDYVENVTPKVTPASFALDTRYTELAQKFPLDKRRYEVIDRDTKTAVALFREENVPLQTQLTKLDQEYDTVCGAMTVQFEGEERTMPQMGVYQESTDRSVRQAAWTASAERRYQDNEKISTIYDTEIGLRHTVATNAGFDNFVGYEFANKLRFDYTPQTCFDFHHAIENRVMPFVARLDAKRQAKLGIDTLMPWDLAVDPDGAGPLVPFAGGVDLVSKTKKAFDGLSPELAEMFATMGDGANTHGADNGALLDLDSRKGKAPGGYQYMQDRSRVPFIFMNAAGLHRDVETMVHEAGHAFHSMYCVDEPLLHYRHSPIEFAEVASMTMELLTMPYWDAYYPSKADANRARKQQLEGSIGLLPWVATIDAFQHWVYENPAHTQEQRAQTWLDLESRFGLQGHRVAWDGIEKHKPLIWQRQGHLFGVPFYYVEYGIAQLGALGLWLKSLEEGEAAALTAYKKALSLGGSRPLPELFAAADLPFDFGDATVARLVERVEAELEKMED
ncbi:MAG: oligoendopeptidase F [Phycisphaerales bacterium]|jgi:oligoendopeptidase F